MHNPRHVRLIAAGLLSLLALASAAHAAEPPAEAVAALKRMRETVEVLSSDEFGGRRVGTPGGDLAADYLESAMANIGLLPPPGMDWMRQEFDVTRGIRVDGEPSIQIADSQLQLGVDFAVAPFSGSGTVAAAPLVFAGYGINAPDLGWNDFAKLEANGAIAVIVRGEPQADDPGSRFSGNQPSVYSDLRRKASNARDLGIAALLVVDSPLEGGAAEAELPESRPTYSSANFDIPVIFVRRDVVEPLIKAGAGASLADLLGAIDHYNQPVSASLNAFASIDLKVTRDTVKGYNIVGMLPGSDPTLDAEYLVIGAHYDHLGDGGPESLATPQYGEIHHGADDNASGVALVLELARHLAAVDSSQRPRSILFTLFSAEEIGAVGSAYLVDHLPIAKDKLYAMLNFDMVGRLADNKLIVGGTGTAAEFGPILDAAAAEIPQLQIEPSASGFGASDHLNFVKGGHPVLFFFTGVHEDYHRPSDTADKINYEGMVDILGYSAQIAGSLIEREGALTFVEVAPEETEKRSRGNLKVTLGTVPSYTEASIPGMAVGDVRPGGPAEQGGILGGDVIVRIGEHKVSNIHDFMFALEGREPGDVVDVTVVRSGAELVLSVTLAARNVEQ